MVIEKMESNEELEKLIDEELERYETKNGVVYNHTPFSFFAKENDEIIGAITGFTCYSEVYIDELVVMENHRGKNIGTQLINTVEEYYKKYGFNNMNLCTNEFQAPRFYEKLGFELEFVRKNKNNPKLNKYFYVKFFDENKQE
ncbi:MAG: GNAT family N-acetyltransferase [Lachnospiraceae bacterium]|nr:GNAT family N-acetyltransferase [Lachnospiraceae bacterium]